MSERQKAECSSCGAPIEWAVTMKSGKRGPLDFEPVGPGNGNVRVAYVQEDGTPVAEYVKNGTGDRVSHFATCPDADNFRKGKS